MDDELCGKSACAHNCRVLQIPGIQHPGIVFPVMACMSGNRNFIDVFGSRVCHEEKDHGTTLALTDRVLSSLVFLQLYTLVDFFPVERKMPC